MCVCVLGRRMAIGFWLLCKWKTGDNTYKIWYIVSAGNCMMLKNNYQTQKALVSDFGQQQRKKQYYAKVN